MGVFWVGEFFPKVCVRMAHNQWSGWTQLTLVIESHCNDRKRGNVDRKICAAMIQRWVRDFSRQKRFWVWEIYSNPSSWWSHWKVCNSRACYVTLFSMVGLLTSLTCFGEYRWVIMTLRHWLGSCCHLELPKCGARHCLLSSCLLFHSAEHKRRKWTQMSQHVHNQADPNNHSATWKLFFLVDVLFWIRLRQEQRSSNSSLGSLWTHGNKLVEYSASTTSEQASTKQCALSMFITSSLLINVMW